MKKLAEALSAIDRFLRPDAVTVSIKDVLTVHPTEFNFPVELNEDNYSCSIQLSNNSDRLIAYDLTCSRQRIQLVSPNEDTYVGTILPRSTCSLTVTMKLTTKALEDTQYRRSCIFILAHVAKYGVKAEDISRENFSRLTKKTPGIFLLPIFYTPAAAAANSSSSAAVPEKNEKGISLLDDQNNNLLSQFINDEVHETMSEGEGSKSSVRRQSSNEIPSIILFSNYDIESATNGLNDSLKIGQGGYGTVYKGKLHDSEVAIKILDPSSDQGIAEFHQEMEVLGRMRHQNLVKLIGACIQLRALVYEFLPHGSVEDYLKKDPGLLTWQIRTRIVYEICSALIFLHSRQPQPVVHGDLKPANILLDANFISKLTDFGLCRFLPGGTATVAMLETQNIQGTPSYIDPDFLETGKLTTGCDVYSFGITMLRILTGAPAARVYRKVVRAIREKSMMAMVDSTAGKWPENVAEYLARMGLECCEPERKSTELMKDILTGLEDILAKIDT